MQVAGADPLQTGASRLVPQLWDEAPGQARARDYTNSLWDKNNQNFARGRSIWDRADEMRRADAPQAGKAASNIDYAQQLAARRVDSDADSIANDAALQAQQKAFEMTTAPMLANKMAAMGMADSASHGQQLANAWTQSAVPLVRDAVQRDQDRLNAMRTTAQQSADQRMRLGQYITDRQGAGLDRMMNAAQFEQQNIQGGANLANQASAQAQQRWNQQKGAIDTGMQVGTAMRDIEQQGNTAAYQDFLRQQGLSQQALYAPFGQSGNLATQVSRTSGGK